MDEKQHDILPPTREEADQMWGNILSNIRKREREKKKSKIITYSVAASVAILILIGSIFGYNTYIRPDIYTAEMAALKIVLPDHSLVILSKGSILKVEKSFPSDTRDVYLDGDAVFRVAKSKEHPFIVHGKGYETKVLGTVFKVSQSGKTFKVDLFEGKVLVYRTAHPKDPVTLAPKQTFTNFGISEAASVSQTADLPSATTKNKSAALSFTECPINDAISVIEKAYGIKVHYPTEIENTKITITTPNVLAETFVQTLALQLNLNIRKNNDSTFELEK
ncbi:FecR family protein [Chryseobacterium polytrichastri]|uniref:FecR family protein n=1 Tax=Chryseobacterium polytrichastri TaxID=1302687 RepID=A0A1M7DLM3_9FLAO|nr:FecR family protein [Chryseobacterium polytrichastri]SHL80414.1 FecR family protein [Chryseobacterium polytrichastri]